MRPNFIKPILLLGALIVIVSLACGGPTPVPIQPTQPPPPTTIPTVPPTYTPYPTYTPPPPPPTAVPTAIPLPTNTNPPPPPRPTDSGPITPANCVPSSTAGYNSCADDTGNITVDVPDYWTEVDGSAWVYNGTNIGVAISAAPNLSDFNNYYSAEGMFFGASDTFAQIGGYVQFLDFYTGTYSGNCTLNGRYDYNDGIYRGKYDQYSNCGGIGGYDAYVLCAVDIANPTSKIILVEIQTTPNDINTVNQIWGTFLVYF
jgi:hypothetical protein